MATFNEILMKAFSGLAGWGMTGDAAHTHIASIGGIGPTVDRHASAIGTTQGAFTWPEGYGPKKIRVRLKGGTSGDLVKICFDAPSVPIATAWLADNGSASTPRMHRVVHNVDTADANSVGDAGWHDVPMFTDPLENLYYVGVGTLGAGTVLEVEAN